MLLLLSVIVRVKYGRQDIISTHLPLAIRWFLCKGFGANPHTNIWVGIKLVFNVIEQLLPLAYLIAFI
jgi:hypothetical protein